MSWLFKPVDEDDDESFLQETEEINAITLRNTRIFFILSLSVITVLTPHLQSYIELLQSRFAISETKLTINHACPAGDKI
jgi:hypothetical protein